MLHHSGGGGLDSIAKDLARNRWARRSNSDPGSGRGLAVAGPVNCRIQVVQDERGVRIVTVAGRLGNAHLPDLLIACGEISPAVHVDLTDMVSADVIAVEMLRRLRDRGALLTGVPTYIQLNLDSPAGRGER